MTVADADLFHDAFEWALIRRDCRYGGKHVQHGLMADLLWLVGLR